MAEHFAPPRVFSLEILCGQRVVVRVTGHGQRTQLDGVRFVEDRLVGFGVQRSKHHTTPRYPVITLRWDGIQRGGQPGAAPVIVVGDEIERARPGFRRRAADNFAHGHAREEFLRNGLHHLARLAERRAEGSVPEPGSLDGLFNGPVDAAAELSRLGLELFVRHETPIRAGPHDDDEVQSRARRPKRLTNTPMVAME